MGVLYRRLASEFSNDEMETLRFGMGIRDGQIWSDAATIDERARLLVEYCTRHGSLAALVRLVESQRPKHTNVNP